MLTNKKQYVILHFYYCSHSKCIHIRKCGKQNVKKKIKHINLCSLDNNSEDHLFRLWPVTSNIKFSISSGWKFDKTIISELEQRVN